MEWLCYSFIAQTTEAATIKTGIQLVEAFSFWRVSNPVAFKEPVQVIQNILFRESDTYGFSSAVRVVIVKRRLEQRGRDVLRPDVAGAVEMYNIEPLF